MGDFEIGDKVQMPGVPIVVTALEFSQCDDDDCTVPLCEIFRFEDPSGQGDDWAHVADFVKTR